ncbi:hypothetical protein M8009_14570 [Halomonas sp. ATCH28]|uniref:Uncharacterized protein n=1 Tax=Halomonas gemina TaxID=2945105 RepID=A0ABT0T3Y6_9GAMM|nr:hypothetical protein [Halomonas gemina]
MRHWFGPTTEVIDAVLDNRAELELATPRPEDPRLAVSLFVREELELVVPASERVQGWDDLARLGFIDHPDGHDNATRLLSRCFPGNLGASPSLEVRATPRCRAGEDPEFSDHSAA